MELESVTLKLPRDLLSGAQRVATARDVTIGHMVRQLLKREVERQLASGTRKETDVRLLVALQALLARDMAEARDWVDLAERLRPHGYELRPAGGGVVLYKSSCGTRVCKGSEIGFGYRDLVKRFGAPMPGHPHSMTHLGVMPTGQIDPTRHAKLSAHLKDARSWPDLINRLAVEGMELRPTGADLGIYIVATGRHLCNSATVGAPYKVLVKTFGAAMPTHPHEMSKDLKAGEEDGDLEVVERG
jgi:hypothetical protein